MKVNPIEFMRRNKMFASFTRDQKEKSGMTDVAMAEEIGVSADYLGKIRNGRHHPRKKMFNLITDYFELDDNTKLEMWMDIQKKKQRAYKDRFYAPETYGLYSIGEEYYKLEKELIKDFGSMGKVPENNRKLKKIRRMVGVS